MSAKNSEYLLLFRGPCWDEGLSDEEVQQVMSRVTAWFEGLRTQGKIKGGEALGKQGRMISAKKGQGVADGPFVESKEAIGGYLMLQDVTYAEAIAIAKANPTLEQGISIEIRELLAECPAFERVQKRMLSTTAA